MFIKRKANKKSINSRKPIYGVGENDADYQVSPRIDGRQFLCPFYSRWVAVLERCYSKKLHKKRQTYKDCTISDEWKTFSIFKDWMIKQNWEGMCLDKDILIPNNKHYSAETCVFVTNEINTFFYNESSNRGKYLLGVTWHKPLRKFQAQIFTNGKKKNLGYFETEIEAYNEYKKAKIIQIEILISDNSNNNIKSGLIAHRDLLIKGN